MVALFATSVRAETLLPPDLTRTIGTAIRFDGFVDENGVEPLSAPDVDSDGRPWIVSPMYTRCPNTCSAVTAGLQRALDQSGLAASEYRVLSFSFDPDETAEGLRAFRTKMQLPSTWVTLRARDRESLERALRSLDFRTISIGDGNFDHPNLVAVLAPDMRLASYLFGINIPAAELAGAVRRAREGISAVDAWRPYLFLFAAAGFLASALIFALLLSRRHARARRTLLNPSTSTGPPVPDGGRP